ncbi:MAG: hypothetical protein ACR2HJ_01670 [Fimbriimonadales bacterium]
MRLRAGHVVHYKIRVTITGDTRQEVLAEVELLMDGVLESVGPQSRGWRAVFVQSVNLNYT